MMMRVLVAAIVWGAWASIPAATIVVDWNGSADFIAIQPAIDAARDGDTVVIGDGVYRGPGNRDLDFRGKGITVRSENGPDACVIDCEGSEEDPHRGFVFQSGETEASVLMGLTIENGYVAGTGWEGGAGGGIVCLEPRGFPTIRGNRIVGNHATAGGGIFYFGSPRIMDNVIEENTAEEGGGINAYEWGIISKNTIVRNRAQRGGGIIAWEDYEPTIVNNFIAQNVAEFQGGGIVVKDCGPTIVGNLIVENVSQGEGGGLYVDGTPILMHNTIFGNQATVRGGGICGYSSAPVGPLINCIVWGNAPVSSTIDAGYSCVEGPAEGEHNIRADPTFINVEDHDYRLRPDSPCIDTGRAFADASLDWNGQPRPCGGAPDMGALEVPTDECQDRRKWFLRGYSSPDSRFDMSDAIYTLMYLYVGGDEPRCLDAADFDDSGAIDLTDPVAMLSYLFIGEWSPHSPAASYSPDLTLDDLSCESFPACREP